MKTDQIAAYLRANAFVDLKAVWFWQNVVDGSVKIRVTTTDQREFMVRVPAEAVMRARNPEAVLLEALKGLADEINTQSAQPRPELIRDYVADLMRES